MSEEEYKAINRIKRAIEKSYIDNVFKYDLEKILNLIETQQKELDKKDKIIYLMAEKINEAYFEENDFEIWFEKYICKVQKKENYNYLKTSIIDYFTKKVED